MSDQCVIELIPRWLKYKISLTCCCAFSILAALALVTLAAADAAFATDTELTTEGSDCCATIAVVTETDEGAAEEVDDTARLAKAFVSKLTPTLPAALATGTACCADTPLVLLTACEGSVDDDGGGL